MVTVGGGLKSLNAHNSSKAANFVRTIDLLCSLIIVRHATAIPGSRRSFFAKHAATHFTSSENKQFIFAV